MTGHIDDLGYFRSGRARYETARLAVALLQVLAQRNAKLTRRIESHSVDTIERRLARSLIRFSDRLGTPEEDGSIRIIMPFTHELLSRYVGASREIITQLYESIPKTGYLSYSGRGVLLHRGSLQTVLARSGSPSAETIS